ncbi:MAK16-related protein, putative [Plasmodium knowlesi strain H]|uniref:MAK16-related protein, putative n=3 Tax=Plasmodium knowlesi TaxID=5850 RepID=A0A5K1V849_PLAKH|nr:protein MAK16, putative [Plasmodium knowlesi strain H]OTN66604.1 putative MAK16-related protein [Plasmodium knowlesi]CAA9986813.1 protein MAK16, putative [Plasmodium knowlesi strain H]SBO23661.1 MAK16-related protein, putative [Plasmodium knowlesi strain H]SBO25231.1 MAK16-related protein, putative [Plasmodium knowlesi strain H]VVS76287.1 protein MAK16, putative [Plasmodium knowlesi strain H]|eukprot:XP_002257998.1 MAK16-related protein, putative [Plasmodium knowlesi strain H]
MNDDTITWEILGKGKCSFKKKTQTQMFCMNEYNVTGLCTKVNCPLSNSVYGTVILDKGEIYLYLKYPEKAHLPSSMWTRIQLSQNKKEAFNAIYKEMKYTHNIKQIKKCMKRYARMKEILKRSRKLILQKQVKLVPIKKKTERRDRTRENKALKAANILNNVEKELLNRLNSGVYGNLYKFLTPKKKVKNKDSELAKLFDEVEDAQDMKMKKKKKKVEQEEEKDEYSDEEGEEEEEEEEEAEEAEDDEDNDDDEDDGDDHDDDDEGSGDDEDEEEDDDEDEDDLEDEEEDDDEDDYDDEEEDEEEEDEEEGDVDEDDEPRGRKTKKKQKFAKEYVDGEHIRTLQEEGKLFDEDEVEEFDGNFTKKRNTKAGGKKDKKKIRIAYEND